MKIETQQDENTLGVVGDVASLAESEPQVTSVTFDEGMTIKVEEDELAPTTTGDTTIRMDN